MIAFYNIVGRSPVEVIAEAESSSMKILYNQLKKKFDNNQLVHQAQPVRPPSETYPISPVLQDSELPFKNTCIGEINIYFFKQVTMQNPTIRDYLS